MKEGFKVREDEGKTQIQTQTEDNSSNAMTDGVHRKEEGWEG